MNGTDSQEAGQFAGDIPLTGHNIQGHSINVMLVRDMPAEVLRTSVTHFGTRGLFGQPVRRTGQHDQDNVRRKRWRVAQSAKPKVKPKPNDRSEGDEGQEHQEGSQHSAGVASPVPGDAPRSVNKPGEKILDLSPPFRSSLSITIATPSSLPTSFTRSAQVLRTGSLPVVHEKKTHYSRSQTLPSASKSATRSPTSADRSEHVPSPCRSFSEPNVVNPLYNSPTDFTAYPSRYGVVSASQGHMPPEAKHARTSTGYGINAAESINNCGGVDASASASPPIRHESSGVRVATAAQQTVGTVLRDGLIVDANLDARHSVTLPTHSQLRHETTLHWRCEASPSALRSDRSDRPLATSASNESWSNQIQASAPSCLSTAPGETHPTWYGYPATAGVYANPSSAIGMAARSSIAPSPGVNTYPVQNYTPPVNRGGTSVWSSATSRHEGEGWVVAPRPPPDAYSAYSAVQSPAIAFNQYAQGHNTPTFDPTVQSDEHIRALVDLYTRPPSGTYVEGAIGSSGPVNMSTSVSEAVWPMAPEPRLEANGAEPNLDTCYGGAPSVGASGIANTYPSGAGPAVSGAYYPHTFVGDLDTSTTPLWAHQVRPMDPMCEDHDPAIRERGLQQEHAAHPTASWTHRSGSEPEYPVHGADNRLIYSAVATSDKLYNAPHQNFPGPTG